MTPGRINAVDIPAEILLFVVTVSALRTFDRVFLDDSFTRPLLTTALVVHLVLFITRRLRGGLLLSFLTSLVALVLQITATFFGDTSSFGLPTGETSNAFTEAIADGWALFQSVTSPAPVATGFLVGASFAIWAVAFLADWAAFRLRTPGEALLPSLAILIFIGLFGLPEGRVTHAALYFAAGLMFVLAHRAAARVSTGNWLGGSTTRAYGTLASAGALVGVLALAVGVFAAPALPWSADSALVEWRALGGADGAGSRKVISPLVDIRGRMVDQQDIEMFTVRSDEGSYWRLTSLDRYNGGVWTSEGDYASASGDLAVSFPTDGDSQLVTQEFTITALSGLWLPTAYQAVSFENGSELGVSYEPDAATLIVGGGAERGDEPIQYTVQSLVPKPNEEFLSQLTADNIDPKYLSLPDGFSPMARQVAQELTEGLDGQYDKAVALQNFFRNNFEYDINVAPGHSERVIEQFLENRVGYCEQFAGTFAAMARSIGLPSRVAVGFTTGDRDPEDPDLFRVRGEHGHAWPEIFLDGAGWVAFEPTPGRGAPNAIEYLPNVVEAQQGSPAGSTNENAQSFDTPTPGPNDPTLPTPVGQQPIEPEFPAAEFQDGPDAAAAPEAPSRFAAFAQRAGLVLLGMGLLLAVIPLLKVARRRSALAATADHPRERIGVAWNTVVEDLEPHGISRTAGETNAEFANRAAGSVHTSADGIRELSEVATLATFAPEAPSASDAEAAVKMGDDIRTGLNADITITKRLVTLFDPRPLLPARMRGLRMPRLARLRRS